MSLWYVLRGNSQETYEFDEEEFHDVKWFDLKDIPFEKSDPHMRRFIKKLESAHLSLNRDSKGFDRDLN